MSPCLGQRRHRRRKNQRKHHQHPDRCENGLVGLQRGEMVHTQHWCSEEAEDDDCDDKVYEFGDTGGGVVVYLHIGRLAELGGGAEDVLFMLANKENGEKGRSYANQGTVQLM